MCLVLLHACTKNIIITVSQHHKKKKRILNDTNIYGLVSVINSDLLFSKKKNYKKFSSNHLEFNLEIYKFQYKTFLKHITHIQKQIR